jgi:hypothetical protein
VIDIRPAEADAVLPKNNPGLIDMKLGAAAYMEMQAARFLGGDSAPHAAALHYITGRGNVTEADIRQFMAQGIAQAVDAEFNRISFMIDRKYNAILTRNAQNQYILSYERPSVENDDKILPPANSLEALSSAMSKSGDFSATAYNTVRDNATRIPAVVFERAGNDSLQIIKDILLLLYTSPSTETYNAARSVYLLYFNTRMISGDSFFGLVCDAYENVLVSLSPDVARKVVSEVNNFGVKNTLSKEQSAKLEVSPRQ